MPPQSPSTAVAVVPQTRLPIYDEINRWKKNIAVLLFFIAVAIEPLYSGFLLLAVRDAVKDVLGRFGIAIPADIYLLLGVSPFVLANLFCDLFSVNPLKEAWEFARKKEAAVTCDLYLRDKLPRDLTEYKGSYILLKNPEELYYVTSETACEKVKVTELGKLRALFSDKDISAPEVKLSLTAEQLCENIKKNGGHTPNDRLAKILWVTTLVIASLSSYFVGGAADALPIAALTENMTDSALKGFINYTTLAIVSILGAIYYYLFNNEKIKAHAADLSNILKHPVEFLKRFVFSFTKYLEVISQGAFNAAYRSFSFAFIMGDLLSQMFGIPETNLYSKLLQALSAVGTGALTAVSRFRQPGVPLFKPDLRFVSRKDYPSCGQVKKNVFFAFLTAAVRGVSLGALLLGLIGEDTLPSVARWMIAASAGTLTIAHACYVKVRNVFETQALEILKPEELARRKEAYEQGMDWREIVETVDHEATGSTSLATVGQPISPTDTSEFGKIQGMLEAIQKDFKSRKMDFLVELFNFMARSARFVGFFGFIAQLNETFGMGLGTAAIIGLAFLSGTEVFKSDGAAFYDSIREVLIDLVTKGEMLKWREQLNARALPAPAAAGALNAASSDSSNDGTGEHTALLSSGDSDAYSARASCCGRLGRVMRRLVGTLFNSPYTILPGYQVEAFMKEQKVAAPARPLVPIPSQ